MRLLLSVLSLLLIVSIGCEQTSVKKMPPSNNTTSTAGIELDEVDAAGLESAIAANSVTLVDFTAVW